MVVWQNYLKSTLLFLIAYFSPTLQETLDVAIKSTTADQATQLAQFLIQPDPNGLQYFLVLKKETGKRSYCLMFEGPNYLSTSMIHHSASKLEIPLEFGHYEIFDRLHYAFKHQNSKIVFIFFTSMDPYQCDKLDLSYPYDLEWQGLSADRRQDIFIYMVDLSYSWDGYLEAQGAARFSVPSNVFLATFDSNDTDTYSTHRRSPLRNGRPSPPKC